MQIFGLLLALVLVTFMGGCSNSSSPTFPNKAKVLVVGMDADYPPLVFKDAEGNLQGVEVDFAKALAEELDRELRIELLPWAQLKDALENHVVDIIMSGVSITKSREAYALFSEPYMQVSQMAVMKEGVPVPDAYTKGRGMKIGYQRYTTAETFVESVFPQSEKVPATSMQNGMVSLLSGTSDYFFADSPAVWYYTATGSLKGLVGWYVPYTQENLAWAMAPDAVALKKEVDGVVNKWRQNGYISKTLKRWLLVRVLTPQGRKPIRFD